MGFQKVGVLMAFAIIVVCGASSTKSKEPPQPTVHVYAVPTFSLKPTSPGENKHYIVKAGSNVTLTCETTFTEKNIFIAWVHPKAKNEYEEKQIHSRHEGMNIKERILHINNARPEDSGSYTCHTRSLHQKTWSSPNTFKIQVGNEKKVEITNEAPKIMRHNLQKTDAVATRTATSPNKKSLNSTVTIASTTPKVPETKTPNVTGTTTPKVTETTTSATKTTTSLPPSTNASMSRNSTQKSQATSNQFNVASFFGGMALIVGILLLVKLIQAIVHKRRQQRYSYLHM